MAELTVVSHELLALLQSEWGEYSLRGETIFLPRMGVWDLRVAVNRLVNESDWVRDGVWITPRPFASAAAAMDAGHLLMQWIAGDAAWRAAHPLETTWEWHREPAPRHPRR